MHAFLHRTFFFYKVVAVFLKYLTTEALKEQISPAGSASIEITTSTPVGCSRKKSARSAAFMSRTVNVNIIKTHCKYSHKNRTTQKEKKNVEDINL